MIGVVMIVTEDCEVKPSERGRQRERETERELAQKATNEKETLQ